MNKQISFPAFFIALLFTNSTQKTPKIEKMKSSKTSLEESDFKGRRNREKRLAFSLNFVKKTSKTAFKLCFKSKTTVDKNKKGLTFEDCIDKFNARKN